MKIAENVCLFFLSKTRFDSSGKKEGEEGVILYSGQYGSFQFQRNIRPNTFIWQS